MPFAESERPPEERPQEPEVAPEDDVATTNDDAAEPAGDQDASNEAEMEEATDRGGMDDAADGGTAQADPEASLREERDKYLDLARRTQADFENYRKRAAKEAAAAGHRAKSGVVRELLPVVDNLERALASAEENEQHLAEGVRLVHSELVSLLQRNGVEQFDPSGEAFDPEFHEALSVRTDEAADSGVVLDVVEKGYRLNGTLLRPARVVVNG